jgi:PBP1b-binding outer membrane lipoprotein LpoB
MKKVIFLLAVIATVLVGCKDKSAAPAAPTVDSTYVDTTKVVNPPQVEEPLTAEPEQNDKVY